MKRPITIKEIRGLPEPKEVLDQMIEVVSAFRIAERQACGNIALAYWRGKQEDMGEIAEALTNDRGEPLLPILLTRKEFISLPIDVRRRTLVREADKIASQDKGMCE